MNTKTLNNDQIVALFLAVFKALNDHEHQTMKHLLNWLGVEYNPPPMSLEDIFKEKYEGPLLIELERLNSN